MSLAEKLVYLRKQKGLTQMALAEKLNVSRQAISRWEVGAAVPSTENLRVLSDLYGVSFDYLLDETTELTGKKIENKEPSVATGRLSHKTILICILLLVMTIAISLGFVWRAKNRHQGSVTPIEDMNTKDENEYSQITFSFE